MSDANSKSPMNNLQLPITAQTGQMLAPSSTAPQKLNSGSATGNPRNKCALKPGHSLMDWIRLGNSGVDLAGTCGRVTPVSNEELARHNTREDAWMAIRGKVFNVTRYMDFHPGGVDELMRGVGRDATKLFDDVHAWVNYQQLLLKCYIGPLRSLVKMDSIPEGKQIGPFTDFAKPPSKKPVAFSSEIVPRFDWIQKRQDVTLYIYTRQLCNPGLFVCRNNANALQLQVQIVDAHHLFEFELHGEVQWPPKDVRVGSESGKIEVTLTKVEPALWSTYGAHTATKCSASVSDELLHEYEVVNCVDFNHNSFELSLHGKQNVLMVLPIGYHVTVAALINGDLVRRSYTPVNASFLQQSTVTDENYATNLHFLVKSYRDGALSMHLRQQKAGQMLLLSAPRGNFHLQRLLAHRQIAIIAAGSGITPMLNLIEHLLKRNANRIFQLVKVLSEADTEWTGLRGRICKELLAPLLTKNTPEYASFATICGPSGFSQAAEDLLRELQFDLANLHIFQG
ncbi:cytochrome b5 reductase 4 isoform X2 [Rhagoletis pomonella]|uniref:cytochrome b5 reductase 4 isoform X2 n=1 Tax=Rhagoletis pomonella TaxID=28610 RepID=UPI0017859EAA|nr:cytochrome b5 reductase 4 isoform X2 [Rhagoletis pomonella]